MDYIYDNSQQIFTRIIQKQQTIFTIIHNKYLREYALSALRNICKNMHYLAHSLSAQWQCPASRRGAFSGPTRQREELGKDSPPPREGVDAVETSGTEKELPSGRRILPRTLTAQPTRLPGAVRLPHHRALEWNPAPYAHSIASYSITATSLIRNAPPFHRQRRVPRTPHAGRNTPPPEGCTSAGGL
jgi:hypothetical protein